MNAVRLLKMRFNLTFGFVALLGAAVAGRVNPMLGYTHVNPLPTSWAWFDSRVVEFRPTVRASGVRGHRRRVCGAGPEFGCPQSK